MNIAALYRRVSTDHQDNSLEVQETLNAEYCERMNIGEGCEVFEDPDASGSIPFLARPGGRALLDRLSLGGVSHLVTSRQDRLGRDTLDCIATIRKIWELGITPHFTSEGGAFPRTAQNELLFEIKASVAQYERNLIRQRTRDVINGKFKQGSLIGTVPYGWDCLYTFADGATFLSRRALKPADLGSRGHGAPVSKQLQPNLVEQSNILRMASWRKAGWTLEQIARQLNAEGHTSKLGSTWQAGNVDRCLRSRHTAKLLSDSAGDSAAAA